MHDTILFNKAQNTPLGILKPPPRVHSCLRDVAVAVDQAFGIEGFGACNGTDAIELNHDPPPLGIVPVFLMKIKVMLEQVGIWIHL